MVGWHHQLNGHECEQALGVGDGQGGLMCCNSWGRKESDTTERQNWTERGEWKAGWKLNSQKTKIMAASPITLWQIEGGKVETVTDFIFLGSNSDGSHDIKRHLFFGRNVITNQDSVLKSRDTTLPTKVHISQSNGFSSSNVQMWELDHKEGWVTKNWCFAIVMLEKTLESPLDYKEIKSVNPKGNQPWIFIGRTDAKAEAPALWPPNAKRWLTGKDLDPGKDWRQKEKRVAEDEMVR